MKSKSYYLALFLLGYVLAGTSPSFAQTTKKKGLKKGPNIALHLTNRHKIPEQTHLNLGLISNYNSLKGLDISAISSINHFYGKGIQLNGIAGITGVDFIGLRFAGIANVTGRNSKGLTIAGLMNISGKDQKGWVISGLGNFAGNHATGLHLGGLINIAGRKSTGVSVAGLANIARGNQCGLAVGGLMNATGDTLKGVQFSALLNVAGKSNQGVQLTALGNVSTKNKGVQMALANYAMENKGLQLGIANVDSVGRKGWQLGIVNISKDSAAHQIGCVNFKPDTRVQLIISGGNLNKIGLGVRFKNRYTYTELGAGARELGKDGNTSLSVFYRGGVYYSLSYSWKLSADAGFYHTENLQTSYLPDRMYSLQPRINLEYKIKPRLGVFASGGYQWTRFYGRGGTYEHKPTFEIGLVIF